MPILSVFFGMIVRMWHDDHPPPHVHVEYQGFVAQVSIETGDILEVYEEVSVKKKLK